MRVAVVAPSPVPFRRGGAERLWAGLEHALVEAGHDAELIKLPVRELVLPDLVSGYEQFAGLDLSHFDLVISGKYPAWMIEHPNHVVYLLHPLRGLYDLYPATHLEDERIPSDIDIDAAMAIIEDGPVHSDPLELIDRVRAAARRLGNNHPAMAIPGPLARAVVHHLDRVALDRRRIRRHAAISRTVARRPGYFPPDVTVDAVHPPTSLTVGPPGPYDDYFFTVSRLEPIKRLDLLVESMRHVPGPTRLLIAGEGPDRSRLESLAAGDPRVELIGDVGDDELAALYANARAVAFVPADEDYGYVALEAMLHARAVLTCSDSGGPTELADERTGMVVDADPRSVGAALARLSDDPETARQLGEAALARARQVTWGSVLETLTSPRVRRRSDPPKVVVLSTYPVFKGIGGGPQRCRNLYASLTAAADVELVSLTADDGLIRGHTLGVGFREVSVPMSARHHDAETELRRLTGRVGVTDIGASLLYEASPLLVREIDAALSEAAGVVLAHPYMHPAVESLRPDLPIVLDAHNAELALKATVLPADEAGAWWLRHVERVERAAVAASRVVTVTTETDAATLSSTYGVPTDRFVVIGNGVDTRSKPMIAAADRKRNRAGLLAQLGRPPDESLALFLGSGHQPNVIAGRAIMESAADLYGTTFVLAGAHTELLNPGDAPPNVRLLGVIGDSQRDALLAGADLALNPMAAGGGSNLKLLEYFAWGVPVVTTLVGARGIPAADKLCVVVQPHQLTEGVVAVLGDPAAASERAGLARRYAEQQADWDVLGKQFVEVVTRGLGL
ncbi:MAG: D-inositol-3-phosphate glycosyltransferase [Acidimicrobiales bacterium]|nr:MAG: glycosyltransferase [Actinomycetota bacterium]MBV6508721.1 D-inositol-3-phosphate glycosyltransferase [Acidimicrobiales bacterium]RIK08152.1 MAG: hypothetical protein DCC48_01900 [Acidobacteriota bacterium]